MGHQSPRILHKGLNLITTALCEILVTYCGSVSDLRLFYTPWPSTCLQSFQGEPVQILERESS